MMTGLIVFSADIAAQPPATAAFVADHKRTLIMRLGNLAWVKLSQDRWAIIDAQDISLVSGQSWHAQRGRYTFYAKTNIPGGGMASLHRVLLGLRGRFPFVDHRDGNGLNNTRGNLRTCTVAENSYNKKVYANNSTGQRGVSWDKRRGAYSANIARLGRLKFLGYFDTPEAAGEAYRRAAANFTQFGSTNP